MTAKHQGKTHRTIKTTRRKTSENRQTADAHGTAEITGQSVEKSSDNNSPGLEESASSITAKHQGKKKSCMIKTT